MDWSLCSLESVVTVGLSEALQFYRDKTVLVTGHTGFKGTWLCFILKALGAKVAGYALPPEKGSLFILSEIENQINSHYGDIRDYESLKKVFDIEQPEVVFHLAAQPLVLDGYLDPKYTYETNVMGTVNVLECIRHSPSVKTGLNVTTDKVYENREIPGYRYVETDQLDGFDPYSNSKSCSELVTHSYISSYFQDKGITFSTARAGNVIGGGDYSANRIIPDAVRAATSNSPLIVRNENSVRPYQHVLEPLFAYLLIVARQSDQPQLAGYYNVGPDEDDCITTGELIEMFAKYWGEEFDWEAKSDPDAPHEAGYLGLNSSKIKKMIGWEPRWNIDTTVDKTVEWYKGRNEKQDIARIIEKQISEYKEALNHLTV